MRSHYQKAYFLKSVAKMPQLPPDEGIEVAIVGRSNAGKSSILNYITQSKRLARVSKMPGRTQLLNVFVLDETRRLIDLPGYGYSKAPPQVRDNWQTLLDHYLRSRKSLKGLLLIMDIRHPFRPLDHVLLKFCSDYQLPVHILLNKRDKLSKSEAAKLLKLAPLSLTDYGNSVTFQSFSAQTGDGAEALYELLNMWYEL